MKNMCALPRFLYTVLALGALFLATHANGSADDSGQSHLQGSVVAHLPLSGAARRIFLRQDGKAQYLYVQQLSGQGFTVIDVTRPGRPKLVKRMPLESRTVMGSGLIITETPDNSRIVDPSPEDDSRVDAKVPESVHVLDVSDPGHPQRVANVSGTSVLEDPARHLVYVVNGDGVWILSNRHAARSHECSSSDAISSIPNCN
jgi:hypothetical protein